METTASLQLTPLQVTALLPKRLDAFARTSEGRQTDRRQCVCYCEGGKSCSEPVRLWVPRKSTEHCLLSPWYAS